MIESLLVNKKQLCQILKVSPQQLGNLVLEGMPTIKSNELYLPDTIAWYIKRQSKTTTDNTKKMEEEKLRKISLEADIIQIEKDQALGELVYIADVAKVVAEEYATVRSQILSLPSALTPKVHIAKSEPEIEQIITKACKQILTELTQDQEHGSSVKKKTKNTKKSSIPTTT